MIAHRIIVGQPSWRVVRSRLPPIGRCERIADPPDRDVSSAIESRTEMPYGPLWIGSTQ